MTPQRLREQTVALARASPSVRREIIARMTWQDVLRTDSDYERWAHESQQEPRKEGWRTWLLMAGRGFGKTRAGAEWIFKLAEARPGSRIALVGATMADARAVMVEGVSGLLAVAKLHRRRLVWEPSLGRLTWPNGTQAQLFSGDSPDGLRGPEHSFAWCDELAKWRLPEESWQNLQMGLRANPHLEQQDVVTIGTVLADASASAICADLSEDEVVGYAAYGRSIRDAVEPLVDAYAVSLFDAGECLRTPNDGAAVDIADTDLGNSADAESAPRLQRKQTALRSLPAKLRLTYYESYRLPVSAPRCGQQQASA